LRSFIVACRPVGTGSGAAIALVGYTGPPLIFRIAPMTIAPLRRGWLSATGLLLLGCFGFAAGWILLGNHYDSLCSALAVPAALDAALLLHLAGVRRGSRRVVLALLVTAASALIAIGGLISARIGRQLGLSPWESAQRLGFEPARLIVELSLDRVDLAWLLVGLVIAVVLSR